MKTHLDVNHHVGIHLHSVTATTCLPPPKLLGLRTQDQQTTLLTTRSIRRRRRRRLTLTWSLLSPCNDHVPRLPTTWCRPGPGYRWLISKFLSIFLVSSAQSCMPGWERESGRRRQVQGGLREKTLQLRVQVTHESRFPITVLITPLFAGCGGSEP